LHGDAQRKSDAESDRYVPVNKGNYSLDTPEREAEFDRRRGAGHMEAYLENRRQWHALPQSLEFPEFPLLVDIELSSVCNLKCPMCYTITSAFKEKVNARLMDFGLFRRIVDEIGGKVFAIRLSLRGEPTMHPRFLDCVRYAKEKGILEVSSLTNGSKLRNPEFCRQLVESGIDWLTVSADGVGRTYEKIRGPIKFDEIREGLASLVRARREAGSEKPAIKVQGIWPAMEKDPDSYYQAYSPVSDLVAFNPLVDYMREIPEDILAYEEDFACPMIFQRLVIAADGKAMMCANDEENDHPVGDANEQGIAEIWNGQKLRSYRETHLEKDGFRKIDICRRCYLPRRTREEHHTVAGRPLIVRNYVNRRDFATSIDGIQEKEQP